MQSYITVGSVEVAEKAITRFEPNKYKKTSEINTLTKVLRFKIEHHISNLKHYVVSLAQNEAQNVLLLRSSSMLNAPH